MLQLRLRTTPLATASGPLPHSPPTGAAEPTAHGSRPGPPLREPSSGGPAGGAPSPRVRRPPPEGAERPPRLTDLSTSPLQSSRPRVWFRDPRVHSRRSTGILEPLPSLRQAHERAPCPRSRLFGRSPVRAPRPRFTILFLYRASPSGRRPGSPSPPLPSPSPSPSAASPVSPVFLPPLTGQQASRPHLLTWQTPSPGSPSRLTPPARLAPAPDSPPHPLAYSPSHPARPSSGFPPPGSPVARLPPLPLTIARLPLTRLTRRPACVLTRLAPSPALPSPALLARTSSPVAHLADAG